MGNTNQGPRLGVNISAGTTLANQGTAVLSNSNGVFFGMLLTGASSAITASIGISAAIQSISAGTAQVTSGQAVFSNSNGISFGMSGGTLTAALPKFSYWDNRQWGRNNNALNCSAMLMIQRVSFEYPIDATRVDAIVSVGAGLSIGVYTMSGSTASLLTSGSRQTFAVAPAFSSVSANWASCPLNWAVTPGEYLIGVMALATNTTNNSNTMQGAMFGSQLSAPGGGDYTNYFANGYYSASASATQMSALPSSMHVSDINQTIDLGVYINLLGIPIPYLQLAGTF